MLVKPTTPRSTPDRDDETAEGVGNGPTAGFGGSRGSAGINPTPEDPRPEDLAAGDAPLFARLSGGDRSVVPRLFDTVYGQMQSIASAQLNRFGDRQNWSTADLVHETFVKMVQSGSLRAGGRSQFLAVGTTAMRNLLVDRARAQLCQKREGGRLRLSLDEALMIDSQPQLVIAVDDAIERLKRLDPRQAEIVEARFFGGMTMQEIAEHLGRSKRWVELEWSMIRSWLRAELEEFAGRDESR